MTFSQLQKPLYSYPDKGGAVFAFLKNGVHSLKCALRETCRRLFVVDLFSAHSLNIDDITNCYKGVFWRYHLLRSIGLLISSNHQQGDADMTFKNWLDTFINEKGLDLEQPFIVNGQSGENIIPLGCVVEAIKSAPATEQAGIKNMLVKIDFINGDVSRYFAHLAQAIAV